MADTLATVLDRFTHELMTELARSEVRDANHLAGYTLVEVMNQIKAAVTAASLGLDAVQNYALATQQLAEAASANNVYMTPLRVKQLITATGLAAALNTNTTALGTLESRIAAFENNQVASKPTAVQSLLKFNRAQQANSGYYSATGAAKTRGLCPGNYYRNESHRSLNLVAGRVYYIPFIPSRTIKMDGFAYAVNKVGSVLYLAFLNNDASDKGDRPGTNLGQTGLNVSSTGSKSISLALNNGSVFTAGEIYWLAFCAPLGGTPPGITGFGASNLQAMLGFNPVTQTFNTCLIADNVTDIDPAVNPPVPGQDATLPAGVILFTYL